MKPPERSPFVVRQEPDRIEGRPLRRIAAMSLLIGMLAVLVSAALLESSEPGAPSPAEIKSPPPLLTGSARGLEARIRERAALDDWGSIDRETGVATIPVDVAMAIVADASLGER
ncbi:MAG: hypothetical protein KF819_12660 [Labilithrix sp.]|nr:hypothetical protein [Labilithrix sp.]